MKSKKIVLVVAVVAYLISSEALFAHHGRAGYNNATTLSHKGTIPGFEWSNPHVQIHFDAPDEKGVVQHWTCEGQNPFTHARDGWTKDEFKPGDQVTITFYPAKNGAGVGLFVKAVLANGQIAGNPGVAPPKEGAAQP